MLRDESIDIKRLAGEDSLRLLPINDLAAEILIDQGSLDKAGALLEKVIAIRERLVESGRQAFETEIATSLLTRARLELKANRHAEAAASALRALRIRDRTTGPAGDDVDTAREAIDSLLDAEGGFLGSSDRKVLEARELAAAAYEELGMFSAAAEQRNKILEGMAAGKTDDPGRAAVERIAAVERCCRMLMLLGHADRAIRFAEDVIPESGGSDGATLSRLRLLGELQVAAEQFTLANASFKTARLLTDMTKAARPTAAARDRLNVLLTDVRRGNAESPPEWYEMDVKRLAGASAQDPDATSAVRVAATLLDAFGNQAAAADLLSKHLASVRTTKQPDPATIADLSGRMADALLAAGKDAAALDVAKKAIAEVGPKLGPGDARIAFLRILLADAQRRQAGGQAAAATLREALARELPRPDDAWEERVVDVVDALAADAPDERFRERFIEARGRQFGLKSRHVGVTQGFFGTSRLAAGDWDAATGLLADSLESLRAALGDEHPEVAATLTLLALAKQGSGATADAIADAAQALAAWEKLAGPEHPGTLAALDTLVSARLEDDDQAGVEPLLERLRTSGSSFTPVQRAGHLVRLALIMFSKDPAGAEEHLEAAAALPCWDAEAAVGPRDRTLLALTAGRAAFIYKQLGQPERNADTLQLARSLATRSDDAKVLLDRVERLAESGRLEPGG